MMTRLCALLMTVIFSGCAVGYTFVNSEGKLDRLSPTMPKDEVISHIGKPDLVLRDDGRVTVCNTISIPAGNGCTSYPSVPSPSLSADAFFIPSRIGCPPITVNIPSISF